MTAQQVLPPARQIRETTRATFNPVHYDTLLNTLPSRAVQPKTPLRKLLNIKFYMFHRGSASSPWSVAATNTDIGYLETGCREIQYMNVSCLIRVRIRLDTEKSCITRYLVIFKSTSSSPQYFLDDYG